MVNQRKMSTVLQVEGPLTTCIAIVKPTLHEIESSISNRMTISIT